MGNYCICFASSLTPPRAFRMLLFLTPQRGIFPVFQKNNCYFSVFTHFQVRKTSKFLNVLAILVTCTLPRVTAMFLLLLNVNLSQKVSGMYSLKRTSISRISNSLFSNLFLASLNLAESIKFHEASKYMLSSFSLKYQSSFDTDQQKIAIASSILQSFKESFILSSKGISSSSVIF